MTSSSAADTDRAPSGAHSKTLRRDLKLSTAEGSAFSLMVGTGETYLAAFVLAVGLGQVTSGLIASVPLLAGALLQLVSPLAVRALGSHRRWIVACARTQAFALVLLAIAAGIGSIPAAAAFLIASVYWGAAMAAGSAWNTWITTLVPRGIRANWFARRSRVMQSCTLGGFLAAGAILQFAGDAYKTTAFALLFGLAALFRFASAELLARHSEPEPLPEGQRLVGVSELALRIRHGDDGRLLFYMLCVTLAAQTAAPFFTPFMLA